MKTHTLIINQDYTIRSDLDLEILRTVVEELILEYLVRNLQTFQLHDIHIRIRGCDRYPDHNSLTGAINHCFSYNVVNDDFFDLYNSLYGWCAKQVECLTVTKCTLIVIEVGLHINKILVTIYR